MKKGKKQTRKQAKKQSAPSVVTPRAYTLFSPKGTRYSVTNISAFAKRFNLDRSALSKVARGEREVHKNWTNKLPVNISQ